MLFYRVFMISNLKIVNKIITCLLNNANFHNVNYFLIFIAFFYSLYKMCAKSQRLPQAKQPLYKVYVILFIPSSVL